MVLFKKTLKLFIPLLIIDIIFSIIAFNVASFSDYLRYIIFDLGLSLFVTCITNGLKEKTIKIINIVIIALLATFAIAELQFKFFLDVFYTFRAVAHGTGAVKEFFFTFVKTIPFYFYLEYLAIIAYLLLDRFVSVKKAKNIVYSIIVSVLLIIVSYITIGFENKTIQSAYLYRENYDILFKTIGSNNFFFNDLFYLTKDNEEKLEIVKEKEIEVIKEEVIEDDIQEEVIEEVKKREFIDDVWLDALKSETDETFKTIDEYLLNRDIEQPNEMTGIYEGKNFIYFMVESLDYVSIDKDLTPTLYKLYTQGRAYVNHYTPVYACGTGDSEYAGMTGTFPLVSNCTLYDKELDIHQSLAQLFKNKDYTVKSFHNWTDEFYPRTFVHLNYGFDEYLDFDGLGITAIDGWLSDLDMVQKALPHIIDEDHFFSLMVTSAMHYPYDYSTTLGDRYLNRIDEVHPDYPIEIKRFISKSMDFDAALEYVLNALDEKGILENTVIGIYGDHAPKTFSQETIAQYSTIMDRRVPYGYYKQPFILYCESDESEINEAYCGSLDNMPTIANMFNLDYDPRLYAGSDIYNGNTSVKFANGDWISNLGRYIQGEFNNFVDDIPEGYVDSMNAEITNIRKVNQSMIRINYFSKRRFVISHSKNTND